MNEAIAASDWVQEFGACLSRSDYAAAANLFVPDGHWRDLLAFTWHFRTFSNRAGIAAALGKYAPGIGARAFQVSAKRTPPRVVHRAGREVLEVIFEFETKIGRANGVARLIRDQANASQYRAWILMTGLSEIAGSEELVDENRPEAESDLRDFAAENWLDRRLKAVKYEDRDPAVLVVGAGQSGLAIAARLGALGVDTLVVDRLKRIGDNWRNRYHALSLHNEIWANDLPYMPFPKTWPTYIPKDKLANWLESYAEAMEINIWTGVEFEGAHYNASEKCWNVKLQRSDGQDRSLRPRHIVIATGVSDIPIRPHIQGLDRFAGRVMHSSEFDTSKGLNVRKAIVIGTGTSGHDVAQQLYSDGIQTTIVQRSSTNVVSLKPSARMAYTMYLEGPPTEDCDLLSSAVPYPVLVESSQLAVKQMKLQDKELLDGLMSRGFKIDFGDDETGYQVKYLQYGGGYYLNVGCSELIIDGKVRLLQFSDIETFEGGGARLHSGETAPADLVVLATGFHSQKEQIRKLLGDEVSNRVGQIWGFDQDGELASMWKRTRQKGLWFTGGGLIQSRIYSKYLALQIKACELGLISLLPPDEP